MKQPIRYFAIGLLTASLLLFIAYYFFKPDAQTATESVDDMIIAIEDEGYRAVTESEYISLAVSDEASDEQSENEDEESQDEEKKEDDETENKENKDQDSGDKEEQEKEEEEEETTTYTLVIEEGMVSPTVSDLLEDNDIIENSTDLNSYLEDEGYSEYIQLGEFDLTSDMSIAEIAKEITNN